MKETLASKCLENWGSVRKWTRCHNRDLMTTHYTGTVSTYYRMINNDISRLCILPRVHTPIFSQWTTVCAKFSCPIFYCSLLLGSQWEVLNKFDYSERYWGLSGVVVLIIMVFNTWFCKKFHRWYISCVCIIPQVLYFRCLSSFRY